MINVVFSTNNTFCEHCCVAIVSLLETNQHESFSIYLLTINCTRENINNIKSICAKYNTKIDVIEISENMFEDFPPTGIYSLACYSRLLLASLFPNITKILYLDCDIIVNGSISELWNIDISHHSLAGVPDSIKSQNLAKEYLTCDFSKGYVNSGVLLINLEYWRSNNIQEKFIAFLKSNGRVKLPDQDAINEVLSGSIKFLHPKYNAQASYFVFPPPIMQEQKKYIRFLWKGATIVHFTGAVKPWHLECVNPYKKQYLRYKNLTPYRNALIATNKNQVYSYTLITLRYLKFFIAKIRSYIY